MRVAIYRLPNLSLGQQDVADVTNSFYVGVRASLEDEYPVLCHQIPRTSGNSPRTYLHLLPAG
jgi:hypothetical protein